VVVIPAARGDDPNQRLKALAWMSVCNIAGLIFNLLMSPGVVDYHRLTTSWGRTMPSSIWARLSAKLFGLALIALLGATAPAAATTMTSTWTGTVGAAIDTPGVFGTAGADLAGANYKLVFTVDSAAGAYSTFSAVGFSGDQIFGGITADLTINGHSVDFSGVNISPTSSREIVGTGAAFAVINQQVAVNSPQLKVVQVSMQSIDPTGFPSSIYNATTISSCSAACVAALSFDITTPSFGFFHGALNFGSLTIAQTPIPVAQTPIPATLPLLVSALGGIGFVGWRRRKAQS
jgi:hypothetical protein